MSPSLSQFMGPFLRLSSVADPHDQISLRYSLQCFGPTLGVLGLYSKHMRSADLTRV